MGYFEQTPILTLLVCVVQVWPGASQCVCVCVCVCVRACELHEGCPIVLSSVFASVDGGTIDSVLILSFCST